MLSKEKCDDIFQRAGSDMGLGFELFVFRASCFVVVTCVGENKSLNALHNLSARRLVFCFSS